MGNVAHRGGATSSALTSAGGQEGPRRAGEGWAPQRIGAAVISAAPPRRGRVAGTPSMPGHLDVVRGLNLSALPTGNSEPGKFLKTGLYFG